MLTKYESEVAAEGISFLQERLLVPQTLVPPLMAWYTEFGTLEGVDSYLEELLLPCSSVVCNDEDGLGCRVSLSSECQLENVGLAGTFDVFETPGGLEFCWDLDRYVESSVDHTLWGTTTALYQDNAIHQVHTLYWGAVGPEIMSEVPCGVQGLAGGLALAEGALTGTVTENMNSNMEDPKLDLSTAALVQRGTLVMHLRDNLFEEDGTGDSHPTVESCAGAGVCWQWALSIVGAERPQRGVMNTGSGWIDFPTPEADTALVVFGDGFTELTDDQRVFVHTHGDSE